MATANMRVSNEERNRAVAALDVHLATGRLDLSEYGERCGRAAVAQTRGELEDLFADLPAPHPDLSSAAPPGQLIQKAGQLVSPPTRGKKKTELVATPASTALEMVAGVAFVFGIPMAILLTIFLGQWWVFIPVVFIIMVAGGTSDSMKKPRQDN
jgi:hypothetical protein